MPWFRKLSVSEKLEQTAERQGSLFPIEFILELGKEEDLYVVVRSDGVVVHRSRVSPLVPGMTHTTKVVPNQTWRY
jgi:hypothetical protein